VVGDAVGRHSRPEPVAETTQAPTAPTNLTGDGDLGYAINLSWTASTDNVGVTSINGNLFGRKLR